MCASQLTDGGVGWGLGVGGLGLEEEGSTNPPTLGEASHSSGTCPEDFTVLRERTEEEECWRSFCCHFSHVNANCHPADRYHHLQNGKDEAALIL